MATAAALGSSNPTHQLAIESGDPAVDGRLFRKCLGQYGTGVAIITMEKDNVRAAVTVNSFASVSLEPPLILWSISHGSRSYPLFKNGRGFAVNILSSSQIDVSKHFSSKIEDKFAGVGWTSGEFGSPLLHGCLAHFECESYSQVDSGDHTILIGLVRRASRFDGEPLLFAKGQYSVANAHPDASPAPETSGPYPETSSAETIISQIFDAHHLISARFDEHRRAEGVDIALARVLACLYDNAGLRADELALATYLGQRDTEDAISALAQRSMLTSSADGGLTLTESGRHLREVIRARWQHFQQQEVAGIPEVDLRTTYRTLSKLIARNRTVK